jgi:hypothetical protein
MSISHPVLTGPDGDIFVGHLLRRCQQISTAIMIRELEEFDRAPTMWASLLACINLGCSTRLGWLGWWC